MSSSYERAVVVPAALSFFAIYNPTLSKGDESLDEQIVYYYSKYRHDRRKGHQSIKNDEGEESREERNERLRQIGLAQGMVGFAKNFSGGKPVDSIETQKSRIVLHEIEPNWWVLVSINFTRLPSSSGSPVGQPQKPALPVEYSSREVCPPALLLQQILRAHRIFLLHQGPSIADLFERIPRSKFCGFLKRFWDGFIWEWEVLLHGNPAVDVWNGIKLAAGGELGMGQGEEEWGSGEREVLEDFIGRTPGLVDLLVSRFGDAPPSSRDPSTISLVKAKPADIYRNWQASERYPKPSDGIVFSGVGAITRSSVKSISSWTEWLHIHGKEAYGVKQNPSSVPRRKRKKVEPGSAESNPLEKTIQGQQNRFVSPSFNGPDGTAKIANEPSFRIPPPVVGVGRRQSSIDRGQEAKEGVIESGGNGTETIMKYLTLGVYGSSWGIPSRRPPVNERVSNLRREDGHRRSQTSTSRKLRAHESETPPGYFLIGLQGQLEEDAQFSSDEEDTERPTDQEDGPQDRENLNSRVIMRTVYIERIERRTDKTRGPFTRNDKELENVQYDRLRVVVYVQPPFIFTFLFELQTDSLAIASFYRSLHHQLGPLQRPLALCTSPEKVSARLGEAAAPKSTASTKNSQPIWDLVYDPIRLTVHTTLPNIPEPALNASNSPTSETSPWTRVEALSVHSQVLNTYTSTRRVTSEFETTCKTSRGWWVVWMRLPHGPGTQSFDDSKFREAFLVRKASDYVAPSTMKIGGRYGRDTSGSGATGGWGPGRLAEGIGIDARQYVEGLLSLNR